ncbi:hypothetical protein CLG96_08925 [Sphingomonas oleivorans]|uniref:Flagellar assembly protein FliH n=1 Tax=Sphingomonas oleivorans TaxID=1735121 RepID=A0A2T5FYF8_9SPHN|nr:FliH/SctL family protein [Sphingomonas oleivorans]PTQ11546.1 hypothetical protein CLG96_08925 [Sphingomonas oleivorans]
MSEFWSPDAIGAAVRVPVWTQPEGRSFAAPKPIANRFTPWQSEPAEPAAPIDEDAGEPPIEIVDPDRIRAEAFAEGFDEGRRTVEMEVAAERDAVRRLVERLETLKPEAPHALAALLSESVKRLVRQIVGEVSIDPDLLLDRARAAAEFITDDAAPRRMRLHPADHARLQGARIDIELVADPGLAEGTVLLETDTGWIEDGPEVRLERLRAALDRAGVR